MFSGTGQINMNSILGNEIYTLCKKDNIKNIVEVGTWNGEGSTVCVMNGIMEKENKSILYSIEADITQYNKAIHFWNNKNTEGKLVLLNGVLHTETASDEDISTVCNERNPYVKEFHVRETNLLQINKIIDTDNFHDIDITILDGGEYTTRGDFNKLIVKTNKVIVLDDVCVFKCKKIRQELLDSSDWLLYKENLHDRHGWSIFINKNYEKEFL
jgi:hypothetical protein